MLTKFHKILIGLLVVQLGLAIVMLARGDEYVVEKPQPLLASFDAAKVTRIQIASSDKPEVDLVKRGTAWVVASAFDYPVDESKVSDLLSQITKLASPGPIATQAHRHKQLGVADADFQRKLTITVDGKPTTLYVGGSAGLRRTAVRIGNDARVFGAAGISAYAIGNDPKQWVATTYASVPQDEIAKVVIDRGGTKTEIVRTLDNKWTSAVAAGQTVDADKLAKLVADVATIELATPADPKRVANPTATITIERKAKDATPAPIVIDVVADGDRYWVKTRGADRAVLVEKARLDDVVTVEPSKIVKQAEPAETKDATKPNAG